MADTAEEARRHARTMREIKLYGVADAMDNYAALLEAQPELLRRLRAAEARIAELEAALRHERTALSLVLERQRQGDRCTVSVRDLQQGISLLDAALTRKP